MAETENKTADAPEGEEEASPIIGASAERILNQEEIDSLLGFDVNDDQLQDKSGIRAIINSALVSYERLPMLEIVFDRLVRLMTTSLRNFTSDNVEVSLDNITSIRFGDYLNSIPLPAILAVFRAEQLEITACSPSIRTSFIPSWTFCSADAAAPLPCASKAGPTPPSSARSSSA